MRETMEAPNYRDEDRDYQWWISTNGDKVRLVVEYQREPDDRRLWRALDLLQRGAAPRRREEPAVSVG